MNVNQWGPGGWIFLHNITFNYPLNPDDSDKKRYSDFFNYVGNMLPCKYCRNSYKVYIKYLPIEEFLDSREGVTYWLYRLHGLVNQKVFKENSSFHDIVTKYEDMRAKCGKKLRDGDKNKTYKTCQKKIKDENKENINIFVEHAEKLFKDKADKMIKKLYNSVDNPNKEYLDYLKEKVDIESKKYDIIYSL